MSYQINNIDSYASGGMCLFWAQREGWSFHPIIYKGTKYIVDFEIDLYRPFATDVTLNEIKILARVYKHREKHSFFRGLHGTKEYETDITTLNLSDGKKYDFRRTKLDDLKINLPEIMQIIFTRWEKEKQAAEEKQSAVRTAETWDGVVKVCAEEAANANQELVDLFTGVLRTKLNKEENSPYLITLKETGDKPYLCYLQPWEYEAVKQGKEYYIGISEITPDGPRILMAPNGIATLDIDARSITCIQPYPNPSPNEAPVQQDGEDPATPQATEEPALNNPPKSHTKLFYELFKEVSCEDDVTRLVSTFVHTYETGRDEFCQKAEEALLQALCLQIFLWDGPQNCKMGLESYLKDLQESDREKRTARADIIFANWSAHWPDTALQCYSIFLQLPPNVQTEVIKGAQSLFLMESITHRENNPN